MKINGQKIKNKGKVAEEKKVTTMMMMEKMKKMGKSGIMNGL